MWTIDLRRAVMVVAIVSIGLTASTLLAQHYHGDDGHHGYRDGHPARGGFSGYRYPSHPEGLHYRGSRPGYGFSPGGWGISIGVGYPYLYDDFGFSDYDYPYLGYGSLYDSYPYDNHPYHDYIRSGLNAGYYADPAQRYVPADAYNPGYHHNSLPAESYGVPGYSSPFAHQPTHDPIHSMARPVSPTSDLRPGMILPDGARVISVGPLGATVPREVDQPGELDQPEEIALPEPADQDDTASP